MTAPTPRLRMTNRGGVVLGLVIALACLFGGIYGGNW